jgi:hypothetical protein
VGLAWRELRWHRNCRLMPLEMDRDARSTVDGASEGPGSANEMMGTLSPSAFRSTKTRAWLRSVASSP